MLFPDELIEDLKVRIYATTGEHINDQGKLHELRDKSMRRRVLIPTSAIQGKTKHPCLHISINAANCFRFAEMIFRHP